MYKYSLSLLATLVTFSQPAIAQTITPAPDGVGTLIQYRGNTYNIGGGTQAGSNLFHSFQEFGLNPNEIANFLSNPDIQNVVGRVVGGNPSVIQGLIQLTGGESNLFLMNPSGWVFTDGASLDVPGSFGVTTANRIGFGSSEFNGTGANDFETLIGSPTSLIFDTTQPGAIINAADLSVDNGSLWMVGGSVVNTGSITAPNGAIALAAVPGESQVRLTHDGMALGLVLDAVPAGNLSSDAPIGLKPEELPRYLTGGSEVGNATGVELGSDGQLYLVGSAMRLEQGDVVIAGEINAAEVQLMAAGKVTPTNPGLVQGNDVTVVRYPEAGGTNSLSIIDSHADNAQTLLYGGAAGTIATIVNDNEDGIGAITETLAKSDALLDGMSITAEGNEGNFWLGNTWVTPETIEDYQSQLAKWSV
ncbi:MAG: filamentous hemagglutinin N-terminal domain-containing protein, partial [Limnothrix sp.]